MAYAFNDDKSKAEVYTKDEIQAALLDMFYPVGSIYMSVNSTNPSLLFGGTWQKIEGRFLLGSSSSYANGATGGSADAVVVAHTHDVTQKAKLVTSNSGIIIMPTPNGADGTNTVTTKSSGVSGTGKNMPPYLVVNIWKRTA